MKLFLMEKFKMSAINTQTQFTHAEQWKCHVLIILGHIIKLFKCPNTPVLVACNVQHIKFKDVRLTSTLLPMYLKGDTTEFTIIVPRCKDFPSLQFISVVPVSLFQCCITFNKESKCRFCCIVCD